MSSGLLVLIAVAVAVVLTFARLWRSAEARAVALAADCEKLGAERQDLTARLSREAQARKKQAEELAAGRKRADKAKKRQTKGAPNLPLGTASRIADLDEQLARAERERDRSRAEREQLAQHVAQLEARIEISARAVKEASAARAASALVSPSATGDVVPSSSPASSASASSSATSTSHAANGLEEMQAELAESRERRAKLEDELRLAKETGARMRKRMTTQEQLYASVRAELEVKKDRLRTQEEQIQRLEAFKVAVSD